MMKLKNVLQGSINKDLEIFTQNTFYEGKLQAVTNGWIVVDVLSSEYGIPSKLNIVLSKIKYIRVISSN